MKRKRVRGAWDRGLRNDTAAGRPTGPHPTAGRRQAWHSLTPNPARKGSPERSFLPWREQEYTTTSKRDQKVPWETASFPMDLRLPCPIEGQRCIWAAAVRGTLPQKQARSLRKPLCPRGPRRPSLLTRRETRQHHQAQPHFRSSQSRKPLLFRA